jgi:ribbon-helix-helix CopG family protein
MPQLTRQYPAVVTVKWAADHLAKLDAMARRSNRSRADTIRTMIACAVLTGQPDIRLVGMDNFPAHGGSEAA